MEINETMLAEAIAEVAKIDAALESKKGTAAERKRLAADAIDQTLVKRAEARRKSAEEATQAVEDAIVEYLKTNKDASATEVDALKLQRETAITHATALADVLKGFGVEVTRPTFGKAPRTTSGGGRPKSSQGRHYVVKNGVHSHYSNDTLSGLAFFAFKRAATADLKSALSKAGVTELTKPWEAEITLNEITLTIGHEVTASE